MSFLKCIHIKDNNDWIYLAWALLDLDHGHFQLHGFPPVAVVVRLVDLDKKIKKVKDSLIANSQMCHLKSS